MKSTDREFALGVLFEYTKSESLRKHAFAVEAAMRAYARSFGEDEALWGNVGLLHDFDYEQHPSESEHPFVGSTILGGLGYPDDFRRAIMSHALHTGISRESSMEKTLFACDELCGFLTAVALVRPEKKIASVEPSSVKKKMKDKAFARSVSREDIIKGCEELGVDFETHVRFVVAAMGSISEQLGL